VGLAQLVGAQHDGFISVDGHPSLSRGRGGQRSMRPERRRADAAGRCRRQPPPRWFTGAVTAALFTIPLWLDLTAVAIGAIQGAMFAARLTGRRIDLLGVALIGVIVGLGGGLMRDLLLNQLPAAISDNWYIPVATAAA